MTINKHIQQFENFLAPEECKKYIEISESIGYEVAKVTGSQNQQVSMPNVRNNQRVLYLNVSTAKELWSEAKHLVPTDLGIYTAIGLNEMIRFYKYEKGQRFRMHSDMSYVRNGVECSFKTFIIYLNDDFIGGETEFIVGSKIKPKQGSLLVFDHQLKHQGNPVLQGTKYVLRTDIMYRQDRNN